MGKAMIVERFREQLAEIEEYLALAEARGDGAQVVLNCDPGQQPKDPKVTILARRLTKADKRV